MLKTFRELLKLPNIELRWLPCLIASILLACAAASPVKAQSYLRDIGAQPFTTALPVENGFINAANGNLHLEIPLGAFPQRGGQTDKVMLMYDSNIWYENGEWWSPGNTNPINFGSYGWPWFYFFNNYVNGYGWNIVTSADPGQFTFGETDSGYCAAEDDYKTATLSPWIYISPDGTQHSFPVTTVDARWPGVCPVTGTPTASGYASDGSGYYISITNYEDATVYAPDGKVVTGLSYYTHGGNGSSIPAKDANGNFYTAGTSTGSSVLYDTLNRQMVAVTSSTDHNTLYFALPSAQGGTNTYTVKLGTVNVHTNFGVTGEVECSCSFKTISEIDLPDGTKYSFGYDSGTTAGHYGQLTSMTLPTGGQIQYSYTVSNDASGFTTGWLTHRTTPDSSTGWSYGLPSTVPGSCTYICQDSVTVTKPSGDNEVYTFAEHGGGWLIQDQIYNGSVSSSNLLSTTTACYNFVTVTNGQCSYNVTPLSTTNIYKIAQTVTLPIPGSTVSKTTVYGWDPANIGNLTSVKEWNFGSLLSNSPDRTTTTTYSYTSGSGYTNAHVIDRPTSVTVTNASGGTVSKTNYCYDYATGCGTFPLTSSFASASGKTNHDDTNYGTTNTVRGDLTQVQRLVSGSTYLTKSMRYDTTGQLLQETDWSNLSAHATSYDYTDHFVDGTPSGPTNAYPTTITAPLAAGSFTETYYYGTGQLASSTDANSQTTSFTYADPFNRLTNTSLPNGGWTLAQYSLQIQIDTFTGITSATPSAGCSSCRHDLNEFDSLGRPEYHNLSSDPDGPTVSDNNLYEANGRTTTVYNPFRSSGDATYGYVGLLYDGLDRPTQINHSDGNATHSYYGAAITSTLGQTAQQCSSTTYGKGYPILNIDEVGNRREHWTDGFGRLIEADEPDSTGALNKKTCYTYDLNNNRTGVLAADGSQIRSYTYDLLPRLTSQTDPETKSTTTNVAYTVSGGGLCSGDPGAICQRKDGRSITTTYSYDVMNRLTGKSYSDSTPSVTYTFDSTSCLGLSNCYNLGRRTGMSDGTGQTAWSYNPIGEPLVVSKTISSHTKTMSYTYNLDGSLATMMYPGGRIVTYTTGNAQRQTSAKDVSNSINYALSALYAPQGALASVQDGSSLISTFFYNNRLELCRISVKNTGTAPATCADATNGNVLDLSYGYGQSSYYGSGSSFNNGNIASVTNNLTSGRTQTYSYDSLNRLLTAQSAATSGADCWGQGFGTYNATLPTLPLADDALNNQLLVTSLKCSSPAPNWSVNSYNQISNTGYIFGNSGGNTADGGTDTYTYDAENRLISVVTSSGTYCYQYDGNDLRVQKGSATGCITPTWNELYWRNTGGNTIAETDGTGSTTNSSYNEYVFFDGQRIAESNPSSSNVYYYVSDRLGSTRVVTNSAGSPCYEADFLPYGAENTPGSFTNTCTTNYKFTGYERDTETGNDYAFARYYRQVEERFLSPDAMNGDISDPQSLNKYTYVRNNPVNLTDPSGLVYGSGDPCDGDCGGGGGTGCLIYCLGGPGGWDLPDNENREPPSTSEPRVGPESNPSTGEPSDDPWALGCEALGMPCGMQFPGGGRGLDTSGCTYGGGYCGGMIYGLTAADPQFQGGGGPCAYLNDQGTGIESVDPTSSQSECGATGGYFALAPMVNGALPNFQVDSNGNVSHRWSLSPDQCNQMNQGLNRMNALTTVLGTVINWFGGATAGLGQLGANAYLNQQLCGGPSL